jgi:ATP synthase I subunit
MDRELVERVTRGTALALVPAALLAGLVAGLEGALGAASGVLISLTSFRWIVRGSRRGALLFAGRRPGTLWVLGLGLRHVTLFVAIALVLWSGAVHPLALLAGLSLLPPILIAAGLRAAGAAA